MIVALNKGGMTFYHGCESTGNHMYRIDLEEKNINDGRRLVDALSAQGMPLLAALWLYDSDERKWEFIIGSPDVERLGLLHVLRDVQKAIGAFGGDFGVAPIDVAVLNSRQPLVRAFAAVVKVTDSIAHFVRCTFNGVMVEDAWVYELDAGILQRARKQARIKEAA